MIENRTRILMAAARVYSQHGWRGATTRRIADEAGVNEVTIFRQFGSKDALLDAVMHECGMIASSVELPAIPVDPELELITWATAHHEGLCQGRGMIRKMMGEASERSGAAECAAHGPSGAAAQLREYIVRMRRAGFLRDIGDALTPSDVAASVAMLMGALFADALGRDVMPDLFPTAARASVTSYVRLFLRGLGAGHVVRRASAVSADAPAHSEPSSAHAVNATVTSASPDKGAHMAPNDAASRIDATPFTTSTIPTIA